MPDVIVIGGGVIGLTSAYELAHSGATVTVIDQQQIGREASWAGAGMLPPAVLTGPDALKQLMQHSIDLWPEVSAALLSETGIDNEFVRCGSVQFCHTNEVNDQVSAWRKAGTVAEVLPPQHRIEVCPEVSPLIKGLYWLPEMSQVRNPRHLAALRKACELRGVTFREGTRVDKLEIQDERINRVSAGRQLFHADHYVIANGAWSVFLGDQLSVDLSVKPIRGQMLLMKLAAPRFEHIVEQGKQYIVPRRDGRVLIGSTEEDVGFEKNNTQAGLDRLLDFAINAVPSLRHATIEASWSGLRPYATRGYPYLGKAPGMTNLVIANGHFRDGLAQSLATGKVVRDLIVHGLSPLNLDVLSTF